MNKKNVIILCCFWLMAHQPVLQADSSSTSVQVVSTSNNAYEADAQLVLAHIDASNTLKQRLPNFIAEANDSIVEHKGAIPSALALRIADSIKKADLIRNDLFDQAIKHRSALYRIDGNQEDSERITEVIIAMAAAVTLFENHQTMLDKFEGQDLLRQKLNEAYPELGVAPGFYQSSITRANKYEYRKAMSDAISFFKTNQSLIHQHISTSSPSIAALNKHIAESRLLSYYQGSNIFKSFLTLPKKVVSDIRLLPKAGLNNLKFNSSKVVGNTLGLVRWRDGKLKDNRVLMEKLTLQLQPGDILLEKTPFTLTDKTIPGHFGHAAIYTGTAEQLRALGANQFSIINKNLTAIQNGKTVVEALRSGVELNALTNFMNIDDIAVLRPKYSTPEQQLRAVNIALGNLGKHYDFNFDVNTTETLVCSELVYMAYPDIDFITSRVLNSYTITPDDIAIQAGQSQEYPLELVFFVHDGQLALDQTIDQNGQLLYASLVRPERPNQKEPNDFFFNGFLQSTKQP